MNRSVGSSSAASAALCWSLPSATAVASIKLKSNDFGCSSPPPPPIFRTLRRNCYSTNSTTATTPSGIISSSSCRRRRTIISCEVALGSNNSATTIVTEEDEDEAKKKLIGARVKVKVPLKVYHVPRVAPELDLCGLEGQVKQYVGLWKGKRISANLPYKVEFLVQGVKFFAHLKEDEFDFFD